MSPANAIPAFLLAAACAVVAVAETGSASRSAAEPIAVSVRQNIRAVYQIKTADEQDGVGEGLAYVKRLIDAYDEMGIPAEEVHVSAVLHGEAGYWAVQDEPYRAHTRRTGPNPNAPLIRELAERGVSVEICAQTMKKHGWTPEELLPEMKMVVGAYPRVVDLQLQGYAYIRF